MIGHLVLARSILCVQHVDLPVVAASRCARRIALRRVAALCRDFPERILMLAPARAELRGLLRRSLQ